MVIMMFAVHTRRLQPSAESGLADRALRWLLAVEPYVAASFLFIAGYSLVLSKTRLAGCDDPGESPQADWYKRLAARALVLYLIAVVLFVPQYGIVWPDLALSSGILSVIAFSVIVVGALVAREAPSLAFAALAAAVLGITHWLDAPGRTIPGLDAGPGGAFPLVAFTCLGAVLARAHARFGLRAILIAIVLTAPLLVFVLKSGAAWTTSEVSLYPAHGGQLAFGTLLQAGELASVPFWNHSVLGALGLCLPLSATLGLFLALPARVAGSRFTAPIRLLGRHALAAYVAHLGVLGVLDLTGQGPRSAASTWLVIGLLSVGAIFLATLFEGESSVARLARRLYSQKA